MSLIKGGWRRRGRRQKRFPACEQLRPAQGLGGQGRPPLCPRGAWPCGGHSQHLPGGGGDGGRGHARAVGPWRQRWAPGTWGHPRSFSCSVSTREHCGVQPVTRAGAQRWDSPTTQGLHMLRGTPSTDAGTWNHSKNQPGVTTPFLPVGKPSPRSPKALDGWRKLYPRGWAPVLLCQSPAGRVLGLSSHLPVGLAGVGRGALQVGTRLLEASGKPDSSQEPASRASSSQMHTNGLRVHPGRSLVFCLARRTSHTSAARSRRTLLVRLPAHARTPARLSHPTPSPPPQDTLEGLLTPGSRVGGTVSDPLRPAGWTGWS